MAAIEKFLFEYDFDRPPDNDGSDDAEAVEEEEIEAEPEVVVPTFSEEELKAAREEGFANGKEEGVRETLDAAEQKTATALEAIMSKIEEAFGIQEKANAETSRDAVNIATAITRKLFPQFSQQGAAQEVERVILSVMERVIDEPRLTITVNTALQEGISARLNPMIEETGFEGKVLLNADESLPLGDCRIEWGTGTASRDTEAIWAEIDSFVAANVSDDGDDTDGADGDSVEPAAAAAETAADDDTKAQTAAPAPTNDEETAEDPVQSDAEPSSPPKDGEA